MLMLSKNFVQSTDTYGLHHTLPFYINCIKTYLHDCNRLPGHTCTKIETLCCVLLVPIDFSFIKKNKSNSVFLHPGRKH